MAKVKANTRKEFVHTDSKTKKTFYFEDTEYGYKTKSKEEFKNSDKVIHYPIKWEGGAKYKTIKKFTYLGFNGKLPVGVNKAASKTYGFTKTLGPFSYKLDTDFKFKEVIIEKNGKALIDQTKQILYLNEKTLQKLNTDFSTVYKSNRATTNDALEVILYEIFPKEFKKPTKTYTTNALSAALSSWGNDINEFSLSDKKAIQELFDKLTIGTTFLTKDSLKKTKEIIDHKYIKSTIEEFKKQLKQTTETKSLEKKWQAFLKSNSWIFSTIFSQPVILFKDEAYVGGKTLDNQNGKHNDFLIKSSLSNNISFLELKTHLSPLVEAKPYRGKDVFCVSKGLTGSIAQVLNQRDNFQKEFDSIKRKSKDDFETFNSKCLVIVGKISSLSKEQNYSFELYRSNSRDVEIMTFDELLKKIESFQDIIEGKATPKVIAKPKRRSAKPKMK